VKSWMALFLALTACGGGGSPSEPVAIAKAPATPVTVTPPPPTAPTVPIVDETASLQAMLNKGGTIQLEARTYHISSMLNIAVSGTVLQGNGSSTVIDFTPPPAAQVKGCYTDRALSTNCGFSTEFPQQIWANIQKGDTSFVAANADDAAALVPGDWVYIAAWDPGISDAIAHTAYATIADWAQVASVEGTTVNVVTPFRQAFITSIPFESQPGGAVGGGISFQKVIPLSGITIQDLTITVDANGNGTGASTNANVVGLVVVGTQGTLVQNVTVNATDGRGLYSESSKGATFSNVTVNGKQLDEFAETVDLTITGCTFAVSDAPAIGLDLGTAFFKIENNTVKQSSGAGFYALYNVHDGSITGNTIAKVSNGASARSLGIFLYGSPNISVTGNTLEGGEGPSNTGILAEGDSKAQLPEPSTGDAASGNTITGFDTEESGL
jgi:hypothetical protein